MTFWMIESDGRIDVPKGTPCWLGIVAAAGLGSKLRFVVHWMSAIHFASRVNAEDAVKRLGLEKVKVVEHGVMPLVESEPSVNNRQE